MRRTLIIVAALAAAVLAGAASIAPARAVTPTNFEVTLSATLTEVGCGNVCEYFYEGEAIIPHIGHATFVVSVLHGCEPLDPSPKPCFEDLAVSFTPLSGTRGGRKLVIIGETGWTEGDPLPTQWNWFANDGFGYTGSGTYVLQGLFTDRITLSLVGMIRPVFPDGSGAAAS